LSFSPFWGAPSGAPCVSFLDVLALTKCCSSGSVRRAKVLRRYLRPVRRSLGKLVERYLRSPVRRAMIGAVSQSLRLARVERTVCRPKPRCAICSSSLGENLLQSEPARQSSATSSESIGVSHRPYACTGNRPSERAHNAKPAIVLDTTEPRRQFPGTHRLRTES
jgi:hypothetical protein